MFNLQTLCMSISLPPLMAAGHVFPTCPPAATFSMANLRLCCLAVGSTSARPPPSEASGSSERPAPLLPTRIILPKKKPLKWSTGVAPGEYGGPPTSSKLRRYWGGEDPDPLASGDFMWNVDFMARMRRLVGDEPAVSSSSSDIGSASSKVEDSGFLSLNRVMNLDNVEIDLSKELAPTPMPLLKHSDETATIGESSPVKVPEKWKLAPTRREQEKWDRAARAATGGSDVMLREVRKVRGDPEVITAQSRDQYFKLKEKLRILTLGIGAVGVVSAYLSYSAEIATRGALGQPRLLLPVVLVMFYNRWNKILVPDYGLMHLDLIPMLVGFFTYKIATFALAIEDALTIDRKET